MQRDDQEMVNFYERLVKLAAKHHLMVDYHGAYKPTGMERTYPNLITREGVMGNEHNKWSARVTPTHNTTLPFTRMLCGPMDFTPGGFRNKTPKTFRVVGEDAPGPVRDENARAATGHDGGLLQPVAGDGRLALQLPHESRRAGLPEGRADHLGRDARD